MNRFRLATSAMLLGVVLAAGCAGPCGGCGFGFRRMSMFRARGACPCECCSSGFGGGVPIVGGAADFGDGPLLEPPGAPFGAMPSLSGGMPFGAMPPLSGGSPFAGVPPLTTLPPAGTTVPEPFPSLGAPFGTPAVPADPGRISPIPNGAQPFPAGPSSRARGR